MSDGIVTSGTAIIFWPHGGAREPAETIAPSYEVDHQPLTLSTIGNPELAPWFASQRFAPPGPGLASLPTVRLVLPLFGAAASYAVLPAELPEALLDEPAVLQHLADMVKGEESDPSAPTQLDEFVDQIDFLQDGSRACRGKLPIGEPSPTRRPMPSLWTACDESAEPLEYGQPDATASGAWRRPGSPAHPRNPKSSPGYYRGWIDGYGSGERQSKPTGIVEPELRNGVAGPARLHPAEVSVVGDAPLESGAEPDLRGRREPPTAAGRVD